MNKYLLFFLLWVLFVFHLNAQPKKNSVQSNRPKLVVGIVIDQMRWDYLYRYQDRYTAGFKRLISEGFNCDNTFITHLPSATAVGHATIFTGSVPAIDGITGNNWIDQQTGRNWYCTEDTIVQTVGSYSNAGRMSPANLWVTTMTDELRLATNFGSKVIGISLKDRAAILPAGHLANAAFWFDDITEHFISSTYYLKALPNWVDQFNKLNKPKNLVANEWKTLYPLSTYINSSLDNEPWEGLFNQEESSVFPHNISQYYQAEHSTIRNTPFGNTLTLDFAKAAIEGYKLGKEKSTDFLTINCSSTDYIGHMYGPNSIEIEDTYLRLDKELGIFLNFLDDKIGKHNYLLFLTADHGATKSIKYLQSKTIPSGQIENRVIVDELNNILKQKFKSEHLVLSLLNYHINFNLKKIEIDQLNYERIKKETISYLSKMNGILYAIDLEHLDNAPIPQLIKEMIINGYNQKRSGPIIIIPQAGWFDGSLKGTNHGNWNPYDSHVPLIFMGWKVKPGVSNQIHSMTDIAPTITSLLHIQMPSGCIGSAITEVLSEIN